MSQWNDQITEVEKQLGIPTGLLAAIAAVENKSGDPNVVSTAAYEGSRGGAVGVMQIMPETFAGLKRLGKLPQNADIRDPISNILAGGLVLKEGLEKSGGDIKKAIAYYNTSPKRALSGDWLPETRAYVPKVLNKYSGSQDLSGPFMEKGTMDTQTTTSPNSFADASGLESAARELMLNLMGNNVVRVQTGTDLATSLQEIKAQGTTAANSALAAGEASAEGERLRAGRLATLSENMASIMQDLGISPMQKDNFRGQTIAAIDRVAGERGQLRSAITDRQSVGIFDNPIQWLLNQLALPGEIGRHNALLKEQMALENQLDQHNKIADGDITRAVAISSQATAEEAKQAAIAKVEKAKQDAATIKANTASAEIQTALQIQTLSNQDVAESEKLYGIYKDAASQKRADEEFELRKKQLTAILDEKADADIKREDEKLAREAARANLEAFNKFFGRNFTKEDIARLPAALKERFSLAVPLDGVLGRNFPEALQSVITFANIPVMAKQNPTQAGFINDLREEAEHVTNSIKADKTNQLKKPEELQYAVGQKIGEKFSAGVKNVALGVYTNGANPYRAKHMNLLRDPRLADNIVTKVANTSISAGTTADKIKDNVLFEAMVAKVESGEVPIGVAARNIADYYSAAVAMNQKAYAFEILNLPKQTAYLAPVSHGVRTQVTNLADPTVVQNEIMYNLFARQTSVVIRGFQDLNQLMR